jgi:hypothetical protein
MILQGNKRISQLVQLTANEAEPNDLLAIVDVTARETKAIQLIQLGDWIYASGSIVQSASFADTASFILGSNVSGPVQSASFASVSITSQTASFALTSSNVQTASFAVTASFSLNTRVQASDTASYLEYLGFPNGTASYALLSQNANVASSSQNLLYFGGNNGTASYAITTQNVLHTTTADSASYFNNFNFEATVATSSYALIAQFAQSGNASTASFLAYNGTANGTASYALAAKSFAGVITQQGIFLADTQSVVQAQIDDIDVLWSLAIEAQTPIEAFGTVKIPFTASSATTGTLLLGTIDRNLGFQQILDVTPIDFRFGPAAVTGSNESGSIKQTFALAGQGNLFGSYLVFVSASNNLEIDLARKVRFNIGTQADSFAAYPNLPITFSVIPVSLFTFSTTAGGPFTDNAAGIAYSQSIGQSILNINGVNNGMDVVSFFWTLGSVTASNFSNNNGLSTISGIPNSLQYLSCSGCSIPTFFTFASSSVSVFNCNNSNVQALPPSYPNSMSYINCSSNFLTSLSLPATLSYINFASNSIGSFPTVPYGLTTMIGSDNNVPSIPAFIPNYIVSMSFDNNPLSTVNALPSNSVYLSFNDCPLNSLPTLPSGTLYLFVQSCSLFGTPMDNITTQLADYAKTNGTLDLRGNGIPSPVSQGNIAQLQTNGWTVFYD